MFFRPNGLPLVCAPMGGHRWRVVMPNAGDRGGRPPSFEEIQELIGQRVPRRIMVSDPEWLSCFRCQLRWAGKRVGELSLSHNDAALLTAAGVDGVAAGHRSPA